MNVKELVRAKNVDLLVHSYNNEARRVNSVGFINKESREVRALKDRYESLKARFDTDKNTVKRDNNYNYKLKLDADKIVGLNGISSNLKIRSHQ